jgi:hypothetical protein
MPAPKRPNTAAATAATLRRGQETQAGWVCVPPEQAASAAEQEATIQALKARLPYWADRIEEDSDWSLGEGFTALREMRQTASEL